MFLLALELVLQIGAIVAAQSTATRGQAQTNEPHVLCVGDSFTYGIGATSAAHSYPAVLQDILRTRGRQIPVVNAGWPGQTSRDLLERCAARITSDTKVLCVLIGTNDSWRHPAQLPSDFRPVDDARRAFTWQWRTGKLLAVLTGFEKGAWLQPAAPEGERSARATQSEPDTVTTTPECGAVGYRMMLDKGFVPRVAVRPEVPSAVEDVVRRCYLARNRGERRRAGEILAAGLTAHPDEPELLQVAVRVARMDGGDFERPLARLQALHAASPSPAVAESLMRALGDVGQNEQALAMARRRVAEQPNAVRAWEVLADRTHTLGLYDEFRGAAVQFIELAGAASPAAAAHVLRRYLRELASEDPESAAWYLVAAHLLDGQRAKTRLALQARRRLIDRQHVQQVLAAVRIPVPAVEQAILAVVREVYDGERDEAWQPVLRDHLGRLCELATARGCRTVILGYPFHDEGVARQQRAAAEAKGARFVEVAEHFGAELRTRPRADLFVADGHCNDGGYALIARLAAEQVLAALE